MKSPQPKISAILSIDKSPDMVAAIDKWQLAFAREQLTVVLPPDIVSKKPGGTTANLLDHTLACGEFEPETQAQLMALLIMQGLKLSTLSTRPEDSLFWATLEVYPDGEAVVKIRNPRRPSQHPDRKRLVSADLIESLSRGQFVPDVFQNQNPLRISSMDELIDFFTAIRNSSKEGTTA